MSSESTALSVIDRIQDPQAFIIGMGKMFALSTMFGCKTESQGIVLAMHCVMTRQSPLVIMQRYHFIEGKLSMKAEAMLAAFRAAGGRYQWEADGRDGKRAALKMTFEGVTYVSEYTIDEATKAGLVKPDKPQSGWMASRPNMLRARAVSNGVRMLYPESVVGMSTPEELEDAGVLTIDPTDVTVASSDAATAGEASPAAAATQETRGRGRPKKAAAETAASPVAALASAEVTPAVVPHPSTTSTTTPAGIVANDPDAVAAQPTAAELVAAPAPLPSSADPIINDILILKSQMSHLVGAEKVAAIWPQALNAMKIPSGPTDEARLLLVDVPAREKLRNWLSGQLKAAEAKQSKNDLNQWANTPPSLKPAGAQPTTAT